MASVLIKRLLITVNLSALPIVFSLCFLSGDAGDRSAPADHSQVACYRCHSIIADLGAGPSADSFDTECRGCHSRTESQTQATGLPFHENSTRACTSCHSFHSTATIQAANWSFEVAYTDKKRLQLCQACHGAGENTAALSEGHRQAATLYHSNLAALVNLDASETCLLCHAEGQNTPDLPLTLNSAPSFNAHTDHPTGVLVRPGTGPAGNQIRATIDPRIRLVSGKLECQSCHSLSSNNRYHLVGFENTTDLCRACHLVD